MCNDISTESVYISHQRNYVLCINTISINISIRKNARQHNLFFLDQLRNHNEDQIYSELSDTQQ